MKKYFSVILASLVFTGLGAAADEYDDLMGYDWGQSRAPLVRIQQNLRDAQTEREAKFIAEKMIAVLKSDAGYPAKQFACRMCRRLADKTTIPALSELLTDAKLSHMARFALQRNPHDETDAALRTAMDKLDGDLEIGVFGTMSLRRDAEIVPALLEITRSEDEEMARAALKALGNIATPAVAGKLADFKIPANLQAHKDDAVLKCADNLLELGQNEEASDIYRSIFKSSNLLQTRIAALRGIILSSRDDEYIRIAVEALTGEVEILSDAAKRFLINLKPDSQTTAQIAGILPRLSDADKLMVIDIIKLRGDPAAMDSVVTLLASDDLAVKEATIEALGAIGDATIVPNLIDIVVAGGPSAQAAFESLKTIDGPNIAKTIKGRAENAKDSEKMAILRIMKERANPMFADTAIKLAKDDDPAVRNEAIQALSSLAQLEHMEELVDLLLDSDSKSDKNALLKAIVLTGLRSEAGDESAQVVCAGMETADAYEKILLMKALGRLGGEAALQTIAKELKSGNDDLMSAAVATLSNWDTPAAAPYLLDVIKDSANDKLKSAALRGYINAAGEMAETSMLKSVEMFKTALDLAQNDGQRKAVLAGLAKLNTLEALQLADQLRAVEELRPEAELAVVGIAEKAGQNVPQYVSSVLKEISAETENQSLQDKIDAILKSLEKNKAFVTAWLASGPYTGDELFDGVFAPEKPNNGGEWVLLRKGVNDKHIDLLSAFGGNNRVVYAKTAIWSPERQQAILSMGSDDGIKVWLNNEIIHAKNAVRGLKLGEDKVKAVLSKGWNTLLVKIVQISGDWAFSVRILDESGAPLDNIRISPDRSPKEG